MENHNESICYCPICGTELETNYETGHESCWCCLREYSSNEGRLIEVETDIYHLV